MDWTPHDLHGVSLREIWRMYSGKMQAIREQVFWTAKLMTQERVDVAAFIRRGELSEPRPASVATMSDDLREQVEEFQGRLNRGEKI